MLRIIQFILSFFSPALKQKVIDAIQGQLLGQSGDRGGMLGDLMKQFQEKGFGNVFNSWVGTGKNEDISPDQVQEAVGAEKMNQMAQQTGLSVPELAKQLAKHLPTLVDRMTPNGKLPG